MKISRTLGLVLGALCGAAGLMLGATPKAAATTTSAKVKPQTYKMVSATQVYDTMKARKRIVDWTCSVNFGRDSNGNVGSNPACRTTAWLEADFQASADGVDLWDVGAQHRTHQLWVRLVPNGGHTASLTQVTDSLGRPVTITPSQDSNGFYLIECALPNGGTQPVNSYKITTDDPKLHLDVQFVGHEATEAVPKQVDDGGPPSIPPVNEN